MKVTKYIHSCLVVEAQDRTAIFDPGTMSAESLGAAIPSLSRLDDILVTHIHPDHYDPELIKKLVEKFPDVRITGTSEIVADLAKHDIKASDQPSEGIEFFQAPHEDGAPLFPTPSENGYHYLGKLSDPGDSHSFKESKAILALPVQAPWGSTRNAINLALELKPAHVLPIHDWHWSDDAREQMYGRIEQILGEQGITFHKLKTGKPVDIA